MAGGVLRFKIILRASFEQNVFDLSWVFRLRHFLDGCQQAIAGLSRGNAKNSGT